MVMYLCVPIPSTSLPTVRWLASVTSLSLSLPPPPHQSKVAEMVLVSLKTSCATDDAAVTCFQVFLQVKPAVHTPHLLSPSLSLLPPSITYPPSSHTLPPSHTLPHTLPPLTHPPSLTLPHTPSLTHPPSITPPSGTAR